MQEHTLSLSSMKLILVMKQDRVLGTQIVDMIRKYTSFQAILATNLEQAHTILQAITCDYLLLTDTVFADEIRDRLSLLPAHIKPPVLLDLTDGLGVQNLWDQTHMEYIARSIEYLRSGTN